MRNHTTTRVRVRQRKMGRQLTRWLAVPALAIAGAAVGGDPAAASDDIVPTETREVFDALRLQCEGSDGEVAQIACRWTVPDGAAGVKVLRVVVGSGMGRQTVYRTADPSINHYVDSPVRRGVRYLYVVRAFDASGTLVAASRPAVAGVAVTPEPSVEVLRLDCSATGAVTARCRWTAPTTPARVLTLWRSVDGGARERVATFANPFPTSYGDNVPTSTSRAVYAVIATDGSGEIVARSRADGVAFPSTDVIDPEPVRPTTPSTVAPTTTPSRPRVVNSTIPATTIPATTIPATTIPATTIPASTIPATTVPISREPAADVPRTDSVRPADEPQPAGERGGVSRSGGSDESGRVAPSGEQDRAG